MPNLNDKDRDERKWYCVAQSLKNGFQSATITVAITGSLVFLANKYSDGFRTKLSVSGKTATATIPMMFMFFLDSYLTMGKCARETTFYDEPSIFTK